MFHHCISLCLVYLGNSKIAFPLGLQSHRRKTIQMCKVLCKCLTLTGKGMCTGYGSNLKQGKALWVNADRVLLATINSQKENASMNPCINCQTCIRCTTWLYSVYQGAPASNLSLSDQEVIGMLILEKANQKKQK